MEMPRNRPADPGPATLQDALLRNLPPQNLDAEKAVLGGALVRGALLDKLAAELRDEDFYSPAHRAIWRAMVGLWRGAKPVDLVSVAAALTAAGQLETAGGPVYLADLEALPCLETRDMGKQVFGRQPGRRGRGPAKGGSVGKRVGKTDGRSGMAPGASRPPCWTHGQVLVLLAGRNSIWGDCPRPHGEKLFRNTAEVHAFVT